MRIQCISKRPTERVGLEGHSTQGRTRVKGVPLNSGFKDRGMKEQDRLRNEKWFTLPTDDR